MRCRCGYKARDPEDMAVHVEKAGRLNDGRQHGEKEHDTE